MITLRIEGKEAVIKEGTTIRFTRNNPYFSDKGSRSLEVVLPLRGCPQNQRIFGTVHHLAANRKQLDERKYGFTLTTGLLNMKGTAVMISIDRTEAKVQLLEGRSALNILSDEDYVDEMDLGIAWDDVIDYEDPRYRPYNMKTLDGVARFMTGHERALVGSKQDENLIYGAYGLTSAVLLPIYSTTDSIQVNPQTWVVNDAEPEKPFGQWLHLQIYSESYRRQNLPPLAPQPYLVNIFQRILEAKGFHLVHTDPWCRKLIIANTRRDIRLAKILPHWTVGEFIQEFCRFTGCVMQVENDWIRIVKAKDYFTKKRKELKLVDDEYEISVTDGEDADTLTFWDGNVDYQWPDEDPMMRLPDEVWEKAEIHEFNNRADLDNFVKGLSPEEVERSNFLLRHTFEGKTYALLKNYTEDVWNLTEVDYMPPLLRQEGTRETATNLKIVPVRMDFQSTFYTHFNFQDNSQRPDRITEERGRMPVMITSATTGATGNFSVNNAINPPAEQEQEPAGEERDTMEVAFYDGLRYVERTFPTREMKSPLGVMQRSVKETGKTPFISFRSTEEVEYYLPSIGPFKLKDRREGTIGRQLEGERVDMSKTYLFTFYDDTPMDMDAIYIIGGKKYVCVKLEYSFTQKGMDKAKKGYFHELLS